MPFEDDLRKFDKEVLVQHIYAISMFDRERTLANLLHYKKRLQFKKLTEKSHKLLEEMRNTDAEKYFSKWDEHYENWQKIQKQLNKILGK